MENSQILTENQFLYERLYTKEEYFPRYPADWVIRFHNMYLKKHIPSGRVMDYGFGSGNNSVFFLEKGYETWGLETTNAAFPLLKANLESRNLDLALIDRFSLMSPETTHLPYEDSFFDCIISNQVLYYLPSESHIQAICSEMLRCLRPGGCVFFTMMGLKNYYITHHAKAIHAGNIYEVTVEEPQNRLFGINQLIFVVRDESHLKQVFSAFECLTVGYFDQSMFDLTSNFHWIFVGQKP